jgi:hypothetical protein
MGRKLNTYVHVDGKAYGPDDDVPAEVAKKIDNPDVWDDGKGSSEQDAAEQAGKESPEQAGVTSQAIRQGRK